MGHLTDALTRMSEDRKLGDGGKRLMKIFDEEVKDEKDAGTLADWLENVLKEVKGGGK